LRDYEYIKEINDKSKKGQGNDSDGYCSGFDEYEHLDYSTFKRLANEIEEKKNS